MKQFIEDDKAQQSSIFVTQYERFTDIADICVKEIIHIVLSFQDDYIRIQLFLDAFKHAYYEIPIKFTDKKDALAFVEQHEDDIIRIFKKIEADYEIFTKLTENYANTELTLLSI